MGLCSYRPYMSACARVSDRCSAGLVRRDFSEASASRSTPWQERASLVTKELEESC